MKTKKLKLSLSQICHQVFFLCHSSRWQTQTTQLQRHRTKNIALFRWYEPRHKREIQKWLLALKTICVKLKLSTVRQGATQCYYHLCLWRFPDTEFASMQLIVEANFSKSQGLEFVAKASDLQWCQPPLTRCLCVHVCLSACMCVWDTLRRGLGLLRWCAEGWWWMNGTPDVYQYLAVNIPGRRGDVAAENMRWCSYMNCWFSA